MAKYIIEIPDDRICDFVGNTHLLMPYIMAGHKGHHDTGLELTPYTEPDRKAIDLQHAHDIENVARMNYSKGAEDAWDFARRIICPSDCCEDSISKYTEKFLGIPSHKARAIFKDLSYQEAKAKYEEWKKHKDEIHVGDEVVYHGNKYVVGYCGKDEVYHIVDRNWMRVVVQGDYQIFKTGRHFPEVAELLKKMREE